MYLYMNQLCNILLMENLYSMYKNVYEKIQHGKVASNQLRMYFINLKNLQDLKFCYFYKKSLSLCSIKPGVSCLWGRPIKCSCSVLLCSSGVMMAKCENVQSVATLKCFKKIPIYVVEEHNDALQFIYSAIGGKRLPVEGNTLLHLDAHPDMLIPRRLTGNEARSGRAVLPLLEIENWIVPAAAAGHIGHVVWVRPPWATQLADGSRLVRTGDRPDDGLLRIDCPEPYFLSDALYSSKLINDRTFTLTVSELGNPNKVRTDEDKYVKNLVDSISLSTPYILDIDLDFFSTGNPFFSLYEEVNLYDLLLRIYEFDLPNKTEPDLLDKVVENRERQLDELEELFQFLELHNSLDSWNKDKTELFHKVYDLSLVLKNAYGEDRSIDWWAVHAAGCTRDQGGLPKYRCNEIQLANMMESLRLLLKNVPPPVIVTIARSTEDGYCPSDQVEEIQEMVLSELRKAFDVAEPTFHYLTRDNAS